MTHSTESPGKSRRDPRPYNIIAFSEFSAFFNQFAAHFYLYALPPFYRPRPARPSLQTVDFRTGHGFSVLTTPPSVIRAEPGHRPMRTVSFSTVNYYYGTVQRIGLFIRPSFAPNSRTPYAHIGFWLSF